MSLNHDLTASSLLLMIHIHAGRMLFVCPGTANTMNGK